MGNILPLCLSVTNKYSSTKPTQTLYLVLHFLLHILVIPPEGQYIWPKHVVDNKTTNIYSLCVVSVWTVLQVMLINP